MICYGCFKDKASKSVCPSCGYDERSPRELYALPNGAFLNNKRYKIGKLLGKPGGFGVTYLVHDETLNTLVAIKEFFPRDIAYRQPGGSLIQPNTPEDLEIFRYGLTSFLGEARTLAAVSHPNIVKVRDYFQDNGTAYLVMDFLEGSSLNDYVVSQNGGRLPELDAIRLIMPLLDGLMVLHDRGFVHRDIKPLNIYVTKDRVPILLDFGAARYVVGEKSRSLTVILSVGFAPLEQYQSNGKQGTWTDVYAVAATFFMMVTGKYPAAATDRLDDDPLLTDNYGVKNSVLRNAMSNALEVDYRKRTQSIKNLYNDLIEAQKQEAADETLRPFVDWASNYDGCDFRYNLEITLEEALAGVTLDIKVPHEVMCGQCNGVGFIVSASATCSLCNGSGIHRKEKTLRVTIPEGTDSGDRIRLKGEGEVGRGGGASGNLFIYISIAPGSIYERHGYDLKRAINIAPAIARQGGSVIIDTPWGGASLIIPENCKDGQVLRLKSQGVRSKGVPKGDMLCRINIMPDTTFIGGILNRLGFRAFRGASDNNRDSRSLNSASLFSGAFYLAVAFAMLYIIIAKVWGSL